MDSIPTPRTIGAAARAVAAAAGAAAGGLNEGVDLQNRFSPLNNGHTPFPGRSRPSLLNPNLGASRSSRNDGEPVTFDPAQMLVSLMRIFSHTKKFTGTGSDVRQSFIDFVALLESTLSSWSSINAGLLPESFDAYFTLVSVLSISPDVFINISSEQHTIALQLSHIVFRVLMHICSETALRLISQDRSTENGFAAFQRLVKRYANITVSVVGDIEAQIQKWKWPSANTDPQNACLTLNEHWDRLTSYGLDISESNRVTFLLSKLRLSSVYKQLPNIWGGADFQSFIRDTTSLDIFDRVYEHWEYELKSTNNDNGNERDSALALSGGDTCRICNKSNCPGESKCRFRKCMRCGKSGHDISTCRIKLGGNNNDPNPKGGGKDKKCSNCGSTQHGLKNLQEYHDDLKYEYPKQDIHYEQYICSILHQDGG